MEALGGHFGRLEANLSQHRAILRPLGANLEASWDVLRDLAASKRALDGSKRPRHSSAQHDYATAMPQRSHGAPTLGSKTALGEGIRGGGRRIISLLVDSCDLTRPGHKARRIYIYIYIYLFTHIYIYIGCTGYIYIYIYIWERVINCNLLLS